MTAPLNVLGLCGSLRRDSVNRAALAAAIELAPDGMTIACWDRLGAIPHYDQDLRDEGMPEAAGDLVARMHAADGVLIATPEYNYSIPGVLKNAIDWLSRADKQPFAGKPVALLGASPGGFGTTRAQHQLRQILTPLDARVMNRPEVLIGGAGDKFENGKLVHEPTREFLKDQALPAFARWIGLHGEAK